MLMCTSIF
uniref:Uncharacterized protein n=1 Tax=Arundo donax TaxID=35708 RepID=A0A0A9BAC2_ARUDO